MVTTDVNRRYAATGQVSCHDVSGAHVPCLNTGQDGEIRSGMPWPRPRFLVAEDVVEDRLTGLFWSCDALPAEYPLTWDEALAFVKRMNVEHWLGHNDWRLPNRRKRRSSPAATPPAEYVCWWSLGGFI